MRGLVFAATLLLATACTTGAPATDTNPQPPTTVVQSPAPPPAPPVPSPPPAPPTDNCGLAPSDMDDATKVQCGLLPESVTAPTPAQEMPNCTGNNVLVPESPVGPYCDFGGFGSEESVPAEPEPGSSSGTNQTPGDLYEQYRQETGYPYSEEDYDSLYGYQQCGTACGKEPTSGQQQHEWGCQQGYITEGC
ncbi:hypothetical protein GIY23_07265 [Allosaccharopolyspora coralli]|uniref:Uncharacterized protein n=1 Tax=Allosaccharopolyspora coralli TaxID=2665642 RepID=A0A5Q3Q836_9PSEU|nr:hypothetical protein [Allosaccharopolyspora coralli]QGK69354.1 hypothetical protein GIY23_07265 [Allosaccharopolyspora coralli]